MVSFLAEIGLIRFWPTECVSIDYIVPPLVGGEEL